MVRVECIQMVNASCRDPQNPIHCSNSLVKMDLDIAIPESPITPSKGKAIETQILEATDVQHRRNLAFVFQVCQASLVSYFPSKFQCSRPYIAKVR